MPSKTEAWDRVIAAMERIDGCVDAVHLPEEMKIVRGDVFRRDLLRKDALATYMEALADHLENAQKGDDQSSNEKDPQEGDKSETDLTTKDLSDQTPEKPSKKSTAKKN